MSLNKAGAITVRGCEAVTGKCSIFGGIADLGVSRDEGLALIRPEEAKLAGNAYLFNAPLRHDLGLARNLNGAVPYCAMRWDYFETPRLMLLSSIVRVTSKSGAVVWCRPVDFGPNVRTDREIDLSWGAAAALGVATDDTVTAQLIL